MGFFGHIIRRKKQYEEKIDAEKDGSNVAKGETGNVLVQRLKIMDQAGRGCCITTGDRSGKMARNH